MALHELKSGIISIYIIATEKTSQCDRIGVHEKYVEKVITNVDKVFWLLHSL